MRFTRISKMAVSLCFTGLLLGGTASADPAAATIAVETQDNILWTTASVAEPDADAIEIRIMTPKTNGKKRSVFQKCIFNVQGAGDYRCGIDVAEGSVASKKSGTWVTKVLVDGSVTDRTAFSL